MSYWKRGKTWTSWFAPIQFPIVSSYLAARIAVNFGSISVLLPCYDKLLFGIIN